MNAIEHRDQLLNTVVTPILKKHGFRKKGKYEFSRKGNGDEMTIEVINNKWNNKEEVEFGFNLWFYFKELHTFFNPNIEEEKSMKKSYLNFRLSFLLNQSLEIYPYKFIINDSSTNVYIKVKNDLIKVGNKLDLIHNPMDYLEVLNPSSKKNDMLRIYVSLLLIKNDQNELAVKRIDELLSNFEGHPDVRMKLDKLRDNIGKI